MELIVQKLHQNPLDEASNSYVLGYFYSHIALEILQDTGISWDTPWETVKNLLRAKYGEAARSIPQLILREVLTSRKLAESATDYFKAVLQAVRKVRNRIHDAYPNGEEAKIRIGMMEELASDILVANLPRRVKQWVRITKPATIDDIVKTIEDEEEEEKEQRLDDGRRKTSATETRPRITA